MAHFAKLDDTNTVIDCIVIDNANAPDPAPEYSEPLGQAFIASLAQLDLRLEGTWKQTSYHGNFRKQYAGIGFTYDPVADVFIAPQPFPSWVLNPDTALWDAPVPMPTEGGPWVWDEDTMSWVEVPSDDS